MISENQKVFKTSPSLRGLLIVFKSIVFPFIQKYPSIHIVFKLSSWLNFGLGVFTIIAQAKGISRIARRRKGSIGNGNVP